jgi:hypothetical protein
MMPAKATCAPDLKEVSFSSIPWAAFENHIDSHGGDGIRAGLHNSIRRTNMNGQAFLKEASGALLAAVFLLGTIGLKQPTISR